MRSFGLAVLLAGTLCTAQVTPHGPRSSERSAGAASGVEDADREFARALVKADVVAIASTLADTYTFTDPTGRVSTKEDVLKGFKHGSIKIESHDLSELKVQVYGRVAVETGLLTSKAMRDGRNSGGTRFTRVWLKQNGQWKTVAFQETRKE